MKFHDCKNLGSPRDYVIDEVKLQSMCDTHSKTRLPNRFCHLLTWNLMNIFKPKARIPLPADPQSINNSLARSICIRNRVTQPPKNFFIFQPTENNLAFPRQIDESARYCYWFIYYLALLSLHIWLCVCTSHLKLSELSLIVFVNEIRERNEIWSRSSNSCLALARIVVRNVLEKDKERKGKGLTCWSSGWRHLTKILWSRPCIEQARAIDRSITWSALPCCC